MRIDEIIKEDQQFNKAWQIWIQTMPRGMYDGTELNAIKQKAQDIANRGADDMDAISSAAGVVRAQRELKQKPAPKVAPTPQKPAPSVAPEPPRSRGAQIGNQNAFKGGQSATEKIGKAIQKGKDTARKFGGVKQGAQRRNRKLNNL